MHTPLSVLSPREGLVMQIKSGGSSLPHKDSAAVAKKDGTGPIHEVKEIPSQASPKETCGLVTAKTIRAASQRVSDRTKVKALSIRQRFTLFHRMVIMATACWYVGQTIMGSLMVMRILKGKLNPPLVFQPYETRLMKEMAGTSTIYDSPLMKKMGQDIRPRNDSIFIDGIEGEHFSFESCQTPISVKDVYANTFMRKIYTTLVQDTSYRLSFLDPSQSELIAPVVDCSSSAILYEDSSAGRFFFLVRNLTATQDDPKVVFLVAMMMSNQGYNIPTRDERGAAGIATVAFIHDMQQKNVEHHFAVAIGYPFSKLHYQVYELVEQTADAQWVLRSVPMNPLVEAATTIYTSCRVGFYLESEGEQSNIKNEYWALRSDPVDVVGYFRWTGVAVLRDNWAWVHFIHLYFAASIIMELLVLLLVSYRNWQQGHVWLGDAFVCISQGFLLRGICVLVTWYLNNFWVLLEYCYSVGNSISEVEQVYIHPSIIGADLMTLFLMVVGVVSRITFERIDPALCMALFVPIFRLSQTILQLFPSFVDVLNDRTLNDFQLGVIEAEEGSAVMTPMQHWNIHPMHQKDAEFIITVLAPTGLSLVPVFGYILAMKLWGQRSRRTNVVHIQDSDSISKIQSRLSSRSDCMRSQLQPVVPGEIRDHKKEQLDRTQFEIATGTILGEQYGLVSNYDSIRVIKGMKYASADGVYSCGFVIANNRFLVATADIFTILVIKLTRVRYRNVYVYDVDGYTVQEMARLVYPDTLSMHDLLHLNLSILS